MGKIQSAVTGALLSSLGVAATVGKFKQANSMQVKDPEVVNPEVLSVESMHNGEKPEEQVEQIGLKDDKMSLDNKDNLPKLTDGNANKLLTRQQEANLIARNYVMSHMLQMKDFKKRIEDIKKGDNE